MKMKRKFVNYLYLIFFMSMFSLVTACSSNNDGDSDSEFDFVPSGGGSSSSSQNDYVKKATDTLAGIWIDESEYAEWKVYMKQSNTEKASSLMDEGFQFVSDGSGYFLSNRQNNSFTTWRTKERFYWHVISCTKVLEHYEGRMSISGYAEDLEFTFSGDWKSLYLIGCPPYDNIWLTKP